MNAICLDIGTTSAKAAAFADGRRVGEVLRADTPIRLAGRRAELDPHDLLRLAMDLLRATAAALDGQVERIAVAAMTPAVCLLDRAGRPVTPIVFHLDRRSEPEALWIVQHFGRRTLLEATGNLPIPGGIASTILRWLQVHEPEAYRRAAHVAPLTTLIGSHLTGACACDPGTAAFLGTFHIPRMEPWQPMLDLLELDAAALPQVRDGCRPAGRIRPQAARDLGIGTRPHVLVGLMDTSAVCLHAGLHVGTLYNVIGTTDVLALCTSRPKPRAGVLTRPAGTGDHWLAINTMAAVGAAIDWAHRTFFADQPDEKYFGLVSAILEHVQREGESPAPDWPAVEFEPDLAGSRMRVEQRYGQIRNLRLSTSREEILEALLSALARRSRDRLRILSRLQKPSGRVFLAGGASRSGVQRLWTSQYEVRELPADAALEGLARLACTE